MSNDPIVGHKTFRDGDGFRHEPLRQSEADEIMARIDARDKRLAEQMPTERDAAQALFEAWYRLKQLGWKETCYGPTNVEVLVIEPGSSGLHRASRWAPWPEKTWWIDGDAPSNPCLFRPLTDAEKATPQGADHGR